MPGACALAAVISAAGVGGGGADGAGEFTFFGCGVVGGDSESVPRSLTPSLTRNLPTWYPTSFLHPSCCVFSHTLPLHPHFHYLSATAACR